jgi:hypothetical protein
MGAANADTANAAKLRLCLSALLNDLDMQNSPDGFVNTLKKLLEQYFQSTPLTQGYRWQLTSKKRHRP